MLLAINIGNTNTVIGLLDNGIQIIKKRLTKELRFSEDIYTFIISEVGYIDIEGSILASVVPQLTEAFADVIYEILGRKSIVVSPNINTGLDFSGYECALLGSDRIAACAYAWEKYKAPMIVIDMGTATTFNIIDENGVFLGGAILPGLRMGIEALCKGTAQLPETELDYYVSLIGHNTKECILSGTLFGAAAMIEGMVSKIKCEMHKDLKVIITGGNSKYMIQYCKTEMLYEPNLVLKGLEILFRIN